MLNLLKTSRVSKSESLIVFADKNADLTVYCSSGPEKSFIKDCIRKKQSQIVINQYNRWIVFVIAEDEKTLFRAKEKTRKQAVKVTAFLNEKKVKKVYLDDIQKNPAKSDAFVEGICLANYQFLKYFGKKKEKENSLISLSIKTKHLNQNEISRITAVCEGVYHARNLVNEPLSFLSAEQLALEVKKMGEEAGYATEIFRKKKIEALKMGGLLAVNRGSIDPPTFSILEYKPENPRNKKPVILVGKGLVFDTGGLSLKPTSGSMDAMKSDMSGGAAVAGAIYALSKAKVPVHVVGLIPATDNRPGENAYAPQDVITMHDGTTVEVLNTDAEGRMILADALSYAKKYKPELVIDLATLTGAAVVAVGRNATVAISNAGKKTVDKIKKSGDNVYERIVEFPAWDEYAEQLVSGVADLKNVGNREAGAITAGKFLQHFTDYPWIHLDIAGPAYLDSSDSYRPKGGTGMGVRLLFDFLSGWKK